jgi:iron complex transport system substrate-binding protein
MFTAGLTLVVMLFAHPAVSTAAAGGTAVIVDDAGRRIVLTQSFQRIISLYGAHTENLFALGAAKHLIGVSPNESFPAQARNKPVYAYHDDLEKYLAAQPDLVLIRPMIDRGYAALVHRLERHGITVVSLQPGTLDEMFAYWRTLGRLTGKVAEADAMVHRFTQSAARIAHHTAVIARKRRVYFEAIHDRMRTFASGSMPIFALETAGGINVASDAVPRRDTTIADYGKERILARAAQIDVYLAQVGPMNHPTRAIIKNETGFGLIRAVREDQVFLIDEQLVARPTPRLLAGICRIGRILYPHVFDDPAAVQECPATEDMAAWASPLPEG